MSSTPAPEAVLTWLLDAFSTQQVTGLWIYGSFLTHPATANDVDVIVRFSDGWTAQAVTSRRRLEQKFKLMFSMPLHAIYLSETEFTEEAIFLSDLLVNSKRLR